MKIASILAVAFLLTPWLRAETTEFLPDDAPEGFLHYRRLTKEPNESGLTTADCYLKISTISEVTVYTKNEDGKTFYRVRVLSQAMQIGSGNEPIHYYQDFEKKENATNLMLKITRLVNVTK